MFEHFCTNPVRVVCVGTTTDASGDDLRPDLSSAAARASYAATNPGTPLMASVQQHSATYALALADQAGVQAGSAAYRVMFASRPSDPSNAARPELRARDLVLWLEPGLPARALVVAGPVTDEGGAHVAWSVDCLEIA